MLQDLQNWFNKRVPHDWFVAGPNVSADGDEIVVIGTLRAPDAGGAFGDTDAAAAIRRFREETRERRMRIAAEAQERFGRVVSWGAVCGERREFFTSASLPVMTRLRFPERQALDTLIASGVARTRSDALAWCVRLVAEHEGEWLAELKQALVGVEKVRASGPRSRPESAR